MLVTFVSALCPVGQNVTWNKLQGVILKSGDGYNKKITADTPESCQEFCRDEANFKCKAFAYKKKEEDEPNCILYKRAVEEDKLLCDEKWSVHELKCVPIVARNGEWYS